MTKKQTRTLRLRDNRIVEYAEFGDPHGKPIFFFHGCFGSCDQASLAHDLSKKEGIRLIAPNRPGVGRSTIASFHSMLEYADDVRQIADQLKIDTFAILGASAGGCFALACEYAMPERVRLVGAAGCIGQLNLAENIRQLTISRRWFAVGCHSYPRIAEWMLGMFFALSKRYPQPMFRLLTKTSTALDSQLFKEDGVDAILRKDFDATFFGQGGVQTLLLEIRMYFHWGFEFQDFPRKKRVFFWHGEQDGIIPWAIIKRASELIHGAEAILYPGGHLTFVMEEMGTMLTKILGAWNDDIFADRREIKTDTLIDTGHAPSLLHYPRLLRSSYVS